MILVFYLIACSKMWSFAFPREDQDVPQVGHAAPEGRDVQAGHGRSHRLPGGLSCECSCKYDQWSNCELCGEKYCNWEILKQFCHQIFMRSPPIFVFCLIHPIGLLVWSSRFTPAFIFNRFSTSPIGPHSTFLELALGKSGYAIDEALKDWRDYTCTM